MSDILTFDPATEFQVLETYEDFEEEIQKPLELRYFTLDEQLQDQFEKALPKKIKITSRDRKLLEREVDRIKLAQERTIHVTDTEFVIDLSRKSVHVDWIKPIYGDFTYRAFPYKTEWQPLFTPERQGTPNFYPQMVSALPKPYVPSDDKGRPLSERSELVNEEGEKGIRGLTTYERTKTIIRDDGRLEVHSQPMANTADALRIIGQRLEKRPLEIPNPMMEHPFLKSNAPSTFMSDLELNEVFPGIEAIMNHAIPVSFDPYKEARPYLKLYDVRLSQIPQSIWKVKFPPVEAFNGTPNVISVEFPKIEPEPAPSPVLTQAYTLPWASGYHPRKWLSLQVDGGRLLTQILISQASKAGLLAVSPVGETPPPVTPAATPEDCMNLAGDFDTFLQSGLFRHGGMKDVKAANGDKFAYYTGGNCVPIGQVQQERKLLSQGRLPWKESLETDLPRQHILELKKFQIVAQKVEAPKYETSEPIQESERYRDVMAILNDEQRDPEDKADAIDILVRDLKLENRQQQDLAGMFVVCTHTLEVLRNAIEKDRFKFQDEWTDSIEGHRVCRYCGEQVNNDVLMMNVAFDDEKPVIHFESLEAGVSKGKSNISEFNSSLLELKKLFDLRNAGEAIVQLTLSLVGVIPQEGQLLPILQQIREDMETKKNAGVGEKLRELASGFVGVGAIIVLLQIHDPFLIPTRTFGNRPFRMGGFPRDTTDKEKSAITDSVLGILKESQDQFPFSFEGPIAGFFQRLSTKTKETKAQVLILIDKQIKPRFAAQLVTAAERYEEPPEEVDVNLIQLPILPQSKLTYTPTELKAKEEFPTLCEIPRTTVVWTMKLPPSPTQEEVKLADTIYPSKQLEIVNRIRTGVALEEEDTKEIRRRVGLGLPKTFPGFADFVKEADGVAFLQVASHILDVISNAAPVAKLAEFRKHLVLLNTMESSALVRDMAKGWFFEILHYIKDNAGWVRIVNEKVKSDLTFRMLMISKEAALLEDKRIETRERETFKAIMRGKTDLERENVKRLLDIGLAPQIITNADREMFAREYKIPEEMMEVEEEDLSNPEGGNVTRDQEDGDLPQNAEGNLMEVDQGDQGDRADRIEQNEDGDQNAFAQDGGDGI